MRVNPARFQTPFGRDLLFHLDDAVDPQPFEPPKTDDGVTVPPPDGETWPDEIMGNDLIAVWGGVGSGKSYAVAQAVYYAAISRPGCRILVGGKSAGDLISILKPRCDEVFGRRARWIADQRFMRYEFPNGSVAEFRAYQLPSTVDEARNTWEGRDCHVLICDETEQLPPSVFKHSFERCRIDHTDAAGNRRRPTVIWIGRPGAVDHWIREAKRRRAGGQRVVIIRARTRDNPLVSPSYLENLRAGHSPAGYLCIIGEADAMPLEGAIYDTWSEDPWPRGNVIDGFQVDPRLPVVCAIDFGRNHPAVLWIQPRVIDGEHVDVIFDELVAPKTLTPGLIQLIRQRGHPISYVVCDPAGSAKNVQTGQSDIDLLRRPVDAPGALGGGLGVPVRFTYDDARTSITAGIYRVQAAILAADGRRRLACTREVWERGRQAEQSLYRTIQQYEWGAHGEPLKGDRGHHADHIGDALRYYWINERWNDGGNVSLPNISDFNGMPDLRPAWEDR